MLPNLPQPKACSLDSDFGKKPENTSVLVDLLQVPDAVEAAIREADVLDQDGNISLAEFEALMHSADTDVLDLFDTRHHI